MIAYIVAVDVNRKLTHLRQVTARAPRAALELLRRACKHAGLLSLREAARGQRKASFQRASAAGVRPVRRLWRPAMAMATPF